MGRSTNERGEKRIKERMRYDKEWKDQGAKEREGGVKYTMLVTCEVCSFGKVSAFLYETEWNLVISILVT